MERQPETLKLTEDDIREAIEYWLNNEHGYDANFDIDFSVTTERLPPKSGPVGGMSDPVEVHTITATAVVDD